MRKICFRGKTYDKEWVEGSIHIEYGETTKDGKRDKDYRILGMRGECRYVIPETVGQFTGLYDNTKWEELTTDEQALFLYPENGGKRSKEDWKGRPIFEGDIVECISSDGIGKSKIDTIKVKDMTDYNTMVYLNCSNELRNIGNIHDNPVGGNRMSKPDVKINDRGGEWYYCPCCGEQLDKFDEECAFCGEAIEWDEVEDDG